MKLVHWPLMWEGTGRGLRPPRPLLAVPNVTAHPSTASVPITVLLCNDPLLCDFNLPIKGQWLYDLSVSSYTGVMKYYLVFQCWYDCRLKEKFEKKFGRDAIDKAEADVKPCLQNDYLTICEINADIDRCIMHAVMEGELYLCCSVFANFILLL